MVNVTAVQFVDSGYFCLHAKCVGAASLMYTVHSIKASERVVTLLGSSPAIVKVFYKEVNVCVAWGNSKCTRYFVGILSGKGKSRVKGRYQWP